jgi:hypothetical protein
MSKMTLDAFSLTICSYWFRRSIRGGGQKLLKKALKQQKLRKGMGMICSTLENICEPTGDI